MVIPTDALRVIGIQQIKDYKGDKNDKKNY